MCKTKAKTYPVALMLALVGFLATGRAIAQEAREMKQTNRGGQSQIKSPVHLSTSELLVPDSFFRKEQAVQDTGQAGRPDDGLIPAQFRTVREISVHDQQRVQEDNADQALYKAQADPRYLEKTEERFKKEFNQRMKAREL